jgi:beta-lactamase class A
MRLPAGDRVAVALIIVGMCVAAGSACRGGSDAAPAAVTVDAGTPASERTASGAQAVTTPADVLSTPTELPEHCPDPHVTPLPASPTVEPPATATEPPAGATPEPTRPIKLHEVDEVPPMPAADLPPLRPDATLDRLIRDRLGADAVHYAVVIKDLGSGRGVTIDADRVFYAASLFKIEVMIEIFHQREAGLLDFDERYVASDYYSSFDLGPHRLNQCQAVSIGEALAAMMSVSDNVAAVMLQDRAGPRHINAAMAALGLEQTRLTEDGSLPSTAGEMARLVEAIGRGAAVSETASKEMAALMETEEIDDRIPRHLPDGTRVAHKTGNWENATHDAGIVYGKRSTYVMVLMSDLGFDSDAATVEADIARIAWEYFEGP